MQPFEITFFFLKLAVLAAFTAAFTGPRRRGASAGSRSSARPSSIRPLPSRRTPPRCAPASDGHCCLPAPAPSACWWAAHRSLGCSSRPSPGACCPASCRKKQRRNRRSTAHRPPPPAPSFRDTRHRRRSIPRAGPAAARRTGGCPRARLPPGASHPDARLGTRRRRRPRHELPPRRMVLSAAL